MMRGHFLLCVFVTCLCWSVPILAGPALGAAGTGTLQPDTAQPLNLAMLAKQKTQFVLDEAPLYRVPEQAPALANPPAAQSSSPLRLQGNMLRAPADRKNISPTAAQPIDRFAEQRMLNSYGAAGWEQMAVDGQLRLNPDTQQRGFSPYVTGGLGLTQWAPNSAVALTPENNGALGLRYGAGVAYSLGEAFDVTAGYRVNRLNDSESLAPVAERLNMQMFDFGLRYRY